MWLAVGLNLNCGRVNMQLLTAGYFNPVGKGLNTLWPHPLQVKARSRRLSSLFHSYLPYSPLVGSSCYILVTQLSSDGRFFVGHDKSYRQVMMSPLHH